MRQQIKAWAATYRFRHVCLEVAVAVSLAFLVWLYMHSRARETTDYLQIPVQVQLPAAQRDQFALETHDQGRLRVSFTGPSSRIRDLRRKAQRGTLQVALPLAVPDDKMSESTFCDIVHVHPGDIPVPPGVMAELADEDGAIPVTLHRLAERMLPVRLDVTGDIRASEVQVEPPAVLVRGPKAVLDRAAFVLTQPCSPQVSAENAQAGDPVVRDQAVLVTEIEGRAVTTNPRVVTFRCKVAPKQKVYELTDVPVHFLCPVNFPLRPRFLTDRPGKIALRVIGPATDAPPPVVAFIDLTAGNCARGRNLEPIRLQLPKDFQLVQNSTPLVAFYLEDGDRATPTSEKADQ